MTIADPNSYLVDRVEACKRHWPDNQTINIVCHGHSVPAGYFATPFVNTFASYPHLLHQKLKERFPFAVINVIVTAKGGEHAANGNERFEREVLTHRPDLITIDYGLNDRGIGLEVAANAWRQMIEKALEKKARIILLTPSWEHSRNLPDKLAEWKQLEQHAQMIRSLAAEYQVGLADSFAAFAEYEGQGGNLTDVLSWQNHPSQLGHELIAKKIFSWFNCY